MFALSPGIGEKIAATDASGNESEPCTFEITVNDTEPPTITCPTDNVVLIEPGETGYVVTYPDPTVTDNCPGIIFSCSPASGSFFPLGTTEVTCTAEDASGNTADCRFEIQVEVSRPNNLQLDLVLRHNVQVVPPMTLKVEGHHSFLVTHTDSILL
ncbi:HYR domain-containing protein [Oceanobacillus senegalensis]|uniref:HYR domain-containing protein n=1 Tax=Oceanobacillus senegalensis TaxID=1936063 RepID=UPI000A3089FC